MYKNGLAGKLFSQFAMLQDLTPRLCIGRLAGKLFCRFADLQDLTPVLRLDPGAFVTPVLLPDLTPVLLPLVEFQTNRHYCPYG